jgi:hypothetical protein
MVFLVLVKMVEEIVEIELNDKEKHRLLKVQMQLANE